jgi:hypothetical protein
MATQRVKLDYNHLMLQIDNFLSDNSEENDTLVFGIAMGLELLSKYIKNIAERAIELNDAVLIDLLKDLCVLKVKGGTE